MESDFFFFSFGGYAATHASLCAVESAVFFFLFLNILKLVNPVFNPCSTV